MDIKVNVFTASDRIQSGLLLAIIEEISSWTLPDEEQDEFQEILNQNGCYARSFGYDVPDHNDLQAINRALIARWGNELGF